MSDYSKKRLIRQQFETFDFGGGADEVFSLRLPKNENGGNMQGQLVNVGVMVTEVINADTAPTVQVGTAADNDAYAKLEIADGTADEDCFDVSDDTDAILNANIPAGTLVEINYTAGSGTSGGAVTGQGMPFLDMYVW